MSPSFTGRDSSSWFPFVLPSAITLFSFVCICCLYIERRRGRDYREIWEWNGEYIKWEVMYLYMFVKKEIQKWGFDREGKGESWDCFDLFHINEKMSSFDYHPFMHFLFFWLLDDVKEIVKSSFFLLNNNNYCLWNTWFLYADVYVTMYNSKYLFIKSHYTHQISSGWIFIYRKMLVVQNWVQNDTFA